MSTPIAIRSLGFLLISVPLAASADYATPPDQPLIISDSETYAPDPFPGAWHEESSAVRLHVGPVLDLATADPGLFVALDTGRKRVGFRLAGSAVSLGRDGGSAIGSAEVWVRPIELGPLSPVLGAGAGLRDVSRGEVPRHELAGVAVFRGGLELRLPIDDTDARAALSLAGHVPAIVERGGDADATALLGASLAVGF